MPQINVGDIVIVKEVKEEELKEGDIISFRKNDEIITHRIQEIEEKDNQTQYITKGDNNNTKDEIPVEYNNIEGKVEKIIPYLGYATIFLKNKTTILVILLIFAAMYIHDMKKTNYSGNVPLAIEIYKMENGQVVGDNLLIDGKTSSINMPIDEIILNQTYYH